MIEREYLEVLLDRSGGNISAAADLASLNRTYLHRLIRCHGL